MIFLCPTKFHFNTMRSFKADFYIVVSGRFGSYEFPAKIVLSAPGPVFRTAFQTNIKQPQTAIWKSPVVSDRFHCLGLSKRFGTARRNAKRPETTIRKAAFKDIRVRHLNPLDFLALNLFSFTD